MSSWSRVTRLPSRGAGSDEERPDQDRPQRARRRVRSPFGLGLARRRFVTRWVILDGGRRVARARSRSRSALGSFRVRLLVRVRRRVRRARAVRGRLPRGARRVGGRGGGGLGRCVRGRVARLRRRAGLRLEARRWGRRPRGRLGVHHERLALAGAGGGGGGGVRIGGAARARLVRGYRARRGIGGEGGGDEARRRVRRSRPRLVFHAALTSNVRLDARFHLPVARHERGEALDVASQARAHPLREPKDARVRRVQRTRLHRRLVLLVGHRRG